MVWVNAVVQNAIFIFWNLLAEDTNKQFQITIDEESELIDNTITNILQFKLLKEESKRKHRELENSPSLVQRVTVHTLLPTCHLWFYLTSFVKFSNICLAIN